MPTYLCHGFRWHRRGIRGYIARYDIDDGAPEWVIAPRSEAALVDHFYSSFDFLPPMHPPVSQNSSSSTYKHNQSHSNDSSYVSRTSSAEYQDDPKHLNGNSARTRSESISQQSNTPQTRPRTSSRDDTPHATPTPAPQVLSPSSIVSKSSGRFDNRSASLIKLLEEFDPRDESVASGPWAYVADYVVRVNTSVSIADEMFRYEARMKGDPHRAMRGSSDEYGRKVMGAGNKKAGWLEKLRDQLQRGESIRWYVVVCGDEERYNPTGYDETGELLEEDEEACEEEECEVNESVKSRDRAWLRQSQSTQFTEETTATGASVVEGGFEYRIPELAGFGARTPTTVPLRKRDKIPTPKSPQTNEKTVASPSPPETPLSPNTPRSEATRSTLGLRKLFSRHKSETPVQ
ncbi:hypothetical protein GGS20DRAFT_305090 [Poronia punctata]|nr:hypothetical protein GGS20DRAFT_305090 [Poronia punctata]